MWTLHFGALRRTDLVGLQQAATVSSVSCSCAIAGAGTGEALAFWCVRIFVPLLLPRLQTFSGGTPRNDESLATIARLEAQLAAQESTIGKLQARGSTEWPDAAP